MYAVPFLWASAVMNDFCYASEEEKYDQYGRGLLATLLLPIVELQQNEICMMGHLIDPSCFVLVATKKKTTVSEDLCTDYRRTKLYELSRARIHMIEFFFYHENFNCSKLRSSENIECYLELL